MRMKLVRRDDVDFELTFKDVDGNLIDLTDAVVYFTVKKKLTDDDADAVLIKTIEDIDDPTEGIAILVLTKEDTDLPPRDYYFDVQLQDAGGRIASTYAGKFIVSQDVTHRTSIDIS